MSHLGLVKAKWNSEQEKSMLESVQKALRLIMDLTEDPHNRKNRLEEGAVEKLEAEIGRLRETFPVREESVLPGANSLSAEVDVARSVARRAERRLSAVRINFGSDAVAKKYMNRLSDYLYVLARAAEAETTDAEEKEQPVRETQKEP
ncbi:MAG: ATP:cob(I)alamin adenosyltransferase [Lachnospiraceae bacterium]